MAAIISPRDVYDLYYRRSDEQPFAGLEAETDWVRQQVAVWHRKLQQLDDMSEELRRILEKRDSLVFCQHFLTCVLKTWPDHLTGLGNLPGPTTLPPSRQDRDDEEEELRARLLAAAKDRLLICMQVQTLKQLGDNVRMMKRAGAFRFEGPRLLYRVHRPGSHTFFNKDVGFCCPRWLRERNFKTPTKQDFYRHVNGEQATSKGAFETPYISMTESPLRALKLVQRDQMSSSQVSVILGEELWAMNIHFEPTTTIADRYDIRYTGPRGYDRAHYITETHWLARYWIPADCIIMRMPFLQFQEVCKRKGILRGSPNVPFDEDGLEIKDFFSTPIFYSLFASDKALDHGTHDLSAMTEQLSMT